MCVCLLQDSIVGDASSSAGSASAAMRFDGKGVTPEGDVAQESSPVLSCYALPCRPGAAVVCGYVAARPVEQWRRPPFSLSLSLSPANQNGRMNAQCSDGVRVRVCVYMYVYVQQQSPWMK